MIEKDSKTKKAMVVALFAGEIMLENGAETYRVEETMCYILKSSGIEYAESYVTPTGMFISFDNNSHDGNPASFVKRIKNRKINLQKVAEVNQVSRELALGELTLDQAMKQLKEIDSRDGYNKLIRAFAAALAASFFAILLGGNIMDFIPTFIINLAVQATVFALQKNSFSFFLTNIAGGFVSAMGAILFVLLGWGNSLDKTIIGSIMTLVPGVSITNAIRDSISGDLVSGNARATEAILIAIAIASGVGFALKIWINIR